MGEREVKANSSIAFATPCFGKEHDSRNVDVLFFDRRRDMDDRKGKRKRRKRTRTFLAHPLDL